MSLATCKTCKASEDIIARKIHWVNLLCAENVSFQHSLLSTREDVKCLQNKLTNLQRLSYSDHQQILKLYVELEYCKCQMRSNGKWDQADEDKLASVIEGQSKIHLEQFALLERQENLRKQQTESYIRKLEEHVNIVLKELDICYKELVNQTKYYLTERHLLRELFEEEKLKFEVYASDAVKESMQTANDSLQMKFDKILKYKDGQIRRQEHLITVLKQQQEAVNDQYHKISQNADEISLSYKRENSKLKEEMKKLYDRLAKLEKRRALETEGYKTQIKLLNNKIEKT